jgi:xanthine/CO dehydrogenase XdhC/CoxF family maturation factor
LKEINDIIQAFDKAQQEGRQTALATVVHVDGSSYRRPGARMLVTDDGQLTGAISGGCLEGDALRKALYVMNQQKAMLVTYDTMDDDDAMFGVGLGCNGIIQVLIEPVNNQQTGNPIALLKAVAATRRKAVLATLFSLQNKNGEQAGTCLLHTNNETILPSNHHFSFETGLLEDVKKVLSEETSVFNNYDTAAQTITAFIECIQPAVSLVIVGAGNDAMPLVAMAQVLGWQTTVVDGRSNYARKDRFASCQVLVSKPEEVLEQVTIDPQTVFVLMTHNYHYDLAMLRYLIGKEVPYIGSLGPRKKLDRMLNELEAEGIEADATVLNVIYGPSGLDIGAETPAEIALSILAEIKAVLSGRKGQSLRSIVHTIHPRTEKPGQVNVDIK